MAFGSTLLTAPGLRWACTLMLLAACGLYVPTGSTPKRWILVANFSDDTVSVIDGTLDREVRVIPVGRSPQSLAVRRKNPLVAVANSGASSVSLIDAKAITTEPMMEPITVPVGRGPESVAFSSDGRWLFATSYYDRTVTVTDLATRRQVREPLSFSQRPRRLLPSPDGRTLFVLLHDNPGALAAVDIAAWQVLKTIPTDIFPTDLVLMPDGKSFVVTSSDVNTATVIDAASLTVVARHELDTDAALLIHPTRTLFYSMSSFEGQVVVYDYAARRTLASIAVGEWPTRSALTADGRFLYVVNNESNNVVKVDTETNTPILRIAVGSGPEDAVILE
jgi:YVTN family beta-propeller protein